MRKIRISMWNVNYILVKMMLLVSFAGIVLGVSVFWIGFHNADLCNNEKIISLTYNITFGEQMSSGEIYTLDECYSLGLSQLVKGFYISILSFFIFGVSLVEVLINERSIGKETRIKKRKRKKVRR